MRLLVVEDDPQIAEGLALGLRRSGHAVETIANGVDADLRLSSEEFDAVLLDLGLPGMDGLDVLKRLRKRGRQTPVLVLTARDEIDDRVRGLDDGADDYLAKPFDLIEVEARIRAVSRRTWGRSGTSLNVGRLSLQMGEHTMQIDSMPLDLSPREFDLLECLMLRQGRVVTKAQLQEHLGNGTEEISEGAVEIHVHRLRKKLERADVELRTIRGFGYLLRSLHDA